MPGKVVRTVTGRRMVVKGNVSALMDETPAYILVEWRLATVFRLISRRYTAIR